MSSAAPRPRQERSPTEGWGVSPALPMSRVEAPSSVMASAANQERDLPLGELIVRAGLVASNDLYAALATARADRRRLGEVLLEQGLVDERGLARLVAEQEDLDFVDLGKYDLDPKAIELLSE